ncbi:NAD-dependent epimerase/dehydratase family protein [Komagataeibacter rhaeticus]|nr:NAD-dependent epimerase/dehydratase family protein [Komagataeibacter rhaeticus]
MVYKALVAGANGIIGKALLEELARAPGWEARGLSRSHGDIRADLTDAAQTRGALEAAADCTHLFYAAYGPGGGLAGEDTRNAAMLRNLLDGLQHAGAPLRRVVLYQGAKVYGVHLGPVSTPFYEDENPVRSARISILRSSVNCRPAMKPVAPNGPSCGLMWSWAMPRAMR